MLLIPPRMFPGIGAGSGPSPYAAAVLADNPLAYWRLGEKSGIVAANQKGTNPGTYVGAPTLGVAGAIARDPDTAVTLDGATQSVSVADSSPFLFAGALPFTVETWINHVPDASFRRVVSCEDAGGLGWQLFSSVGDYGFLRKDGGGTATAEVFASVPAGWQYVVATYDGTNLRLYRAGGLVAGPVASAQVIPVGGQNFFLGRGLAGPRFNGSLDEIAIYSYALSAGQIAAHFALAI